MPSVSMHLSMLSKPLLILGWSLLWVAPSFAYETCPLPGSKNDTISTESTIAEADVDTIEPLKNLAPPAEPIAWRDLYPNAKKMHALETQYTPSSPSFVGDVSVAETESMLNKLKRYGSWAKGGLEVLGPVFDAVALGLWVDNLTTTFGNQQSTELDKVASVLYLVPFAGDLARDLASADHVNTQINQDIERIKQEHHYLYTDTTAKTRALANAIDSIIQLEKIGMKQELIQYKLMLDNQIITAIRYHQDYALAWIRTLDKALQHLDDQFFKHLYYQLYRAPYQLDQQMQLSRLPLQCEPQSIQMDVHQLRNQQVITHKLVNCLAQMLNHNLLPLEDLVKDRHPHFSVASWSQLGEQMREAKAQLIYAVTSQIANHQAATLSQLQQQLAQMKHSNAPYQARLNRKRQRLEQLSFLHWVLNEFKDIPSEQITLDSPSLTARILPKRSCSSVPSWMKWIPSVYQYCGIRQWLTDINYTTQIVPFDASKDDNMQAFSTLTAQYEQGIDALYSNKHSAYRFHHGYHPREIDHLLQPTMPAINWLTQQPLSQRQIYLSWLTSSVTTALPDLKLTSPTAIQAARGYLLTLKGYQQLVPAWYQKLIAELQSPVQLANLNQRMRHFFDRYPWNQTWFLQQHAEKLGAVKPLLLFKQLRIKDKLHQVSLINEPNLVLPNKLRHWLNQDTGDMTNLPQPMIAQHLDRVRLIVTGLSSQPQHDCALVKRLAAPLSQVTDSDLVVLPFWYHLFNEIQHQYLNYAAVMQPYCANR
ncbi:MAG: hypothetical protein ISP86_01300 [Shewanellaceae bacterium]|nr:hypothetical protein [Shewanellaceae bacterium]